MDTRLQYLWKGVIPAAMIVMFRYERRDSGGVETVAEETSQSETAEG
jgi:hypothetical protein